MKFETAQQMLDFINDGNDLYSRQAEIYIFSYNDAGSVCTYDIDKDEADRLAKQVNDSNENYWGAFLGVGGKIWDDPSHECYKEGQTSNLDCCESLLEIEDWVLTQHYLGAPVSLTIQVKVQLKEKDVDDIMVGSLEGGCTRYWCNRVDVKGAPRQEYASHEIARGGTLIFFDCEEDKTYELDLEKFLTGFKVWLEKGYDRYHAVENGVVDCCNIDAECADSIVQCALFGDIIYG